MVRTTRNANPRSFSPGGDNDQDEEEVHNHWKDDNHDNDKDEKSSSAANRRRWAMRLILLCLALHSSHKKSTLTLKDEVSQTGFQSGGGSQASSRLRDRFPTAPSKPL